NEKKVFKAFGVLAIIAILALNVSVVLDGSSDSILKWDVVGEILAVTNSGSNNSGGSGSGGESKPNDCGPASDSTCYEYTTKYACMAVSEPDSGSDCRD
ncbi:MAG: hypothetical protein JXL97_05490, partial [Bacteroidales bacterium]|nr:hypothetical protein [Fusobacteriaceae bacterium]MBN2891299.1 hypothetical protein [Bacteroidales bacterium]